MNLLVDVAILFENDPDKLSSSQRALALCTKVESMACLLDEWWWVLELRENWYRWISSIHYVLHCHHISRKYQY
jgi:hypothetical protein